MVAHSRAALVLMLALGCETSSGQAQTRRPEEANSEVHAAPVHPTPPALVDMCVHGSGSSTRLCALREDGRVLCAHASEGIFGPPTSGIEGAVELACGNPTICVRDEQGTVSCIDEDDEVHLIEDLPPAIVLSASCALVTEARLYCWLEDFVAEPVRHPEVQQRAGTRDGQLIDLVDVELMHGLDVGCVLQGRGPLWCWDRNEDALASSLGDLRHPRQIADLGEVEAISASASTAGGCVSTQSFEPLAIAAVEHRPDVHIHGLTIERLTASDW